jgi:phage shock protein PspC (stress-responsive transcriptional regulator)
MSDQDTTHQMPEAEPPTEPQPESGRAKRLLRSRDDRMLGGVAGGLGKYFNVDPLIFRIGFGISVFFGGLGALAYLALLLFVPTEESDGTTGEAPIQRSRWLAVAGAIGAFILLASWGIFDGDPFWFDGGSWFFGGPLFLIALVAGLLYLLRGDGGRARRPTGILATVAIVIGSAIAICCLAMGAAWAGATGNGEAIAGVVIAIGVLLVIAAFRGGARWLIVPALALAVPLSAVAAADVSFDGGVGKRSHEPASAAAIPADGYELGIGRLAVDLRDLDWRDDTVVELRTDLGIGQTVVAVPEDVCVTGDLHAGAGAVEVGGDEEGGFDVETQPVDGTTATPRLVLDSEVDMGHLLILNDDDADISRDHDRGPFDDDEFDDDDLDRDAMEDAMAAACSDASAGESDEAAQPDEPDAPAAPAREGK